MRKREGEGDERVRGEKRTEGKWEKDRANMKEKQTQTDRQTDRQTERWG